MPKYKVYSLIVERNYRDGWIILAKVQLGEFEFLNDGEISQFAEQAEGAEFCALIEPNPNPREDSLFICDESKQRRPAYELIEIGETK